MLTDSTVFCPVGLKSDLVDLHLIEVMNDGSTLSSARRSGELTEQQSVVRGRWGDACCNAGYF